MVEQAPPTALDELKAKMKVAISAEGNDADVVKIGKEIVKLKADVEKAEASKIQAEAEALAGDREKLAAEVVETINSLGLGKKLEKVKAMGFRYLLPDDQSDIPRIALAVPTVKTRGGGGGGSTGALKEQTGLARHELIGKYATPNEKAAIQKAFDEATSRKDSARYSAEKPVVKRILADNPNLIKK